MNILMLATHEGDPHLFGWFVGFGVTIAVIVVVVVLVQAILQLAARIGVQARLIDASLQESERNTAPLAALKTTISYVTVIIENLKRARAALGG